MTKSARIPYADMVRSMKAIKAAGIEKARVVMHLERGEIEIVVGERVPSDPAHPDWNEWDDE